MTLEKSLSLSRHEDEKHQYFPMIFLLLNYPPFKNIHASVLFYFKFLKAMVIIIKSYQYWLLFLKDLTLTWCSYVPLLSLIELELLRFAKALNSTFSVLRSICVKVLLKELPSGFLLFVWFINKNVWRAQFTIYFILSTNWPGLSHLPTHLPVKS
jgi:hypothetical protein